MEQVKDNFKHDYNLAVKSFNEKDYTSFFRNIRPCIELLSKLIIYDVLGEDKAVELIEGGSGSYECGVGPSFTAWQACQCR